MKVSTVKSHDNKLVNLLVDQERAKKIEVLSRNLKKLQLNQRQLCDLELLLNGGFSPLKTFMDSADYESVLSGMRLKSGELWPIPVVLDVKRTIAASLKIGDIIVLTDSDDAILALLNVGEIYKIDKHKEAKAVYSTRSEEHPGVAYLYHQVHDFCISGKLEGVQLPKHNDFKDLRKTPADLRKFYKNKGWTRIVAFQTRNPMHRAHVELASEAATITNANLLIHPSVGMTKPGDIDYTTRVNTYKQALKHFPADTTVLSLLPLAMRMAGPREALWHAIIRKNYGATHFIVGRDHAGPGKNSQGLPFYEPYAAKQLVESHADELGIQIVGFTTTVYVPSEKRYRPLKSLPKGTKHLNLSGTEMRKLLRDGSKLPEWFTYPEVADELKNTNSRTRDKGLTIFFTGLSAAGKSTIANVLQVKLHQLDNRQINMLDGDEVRKQFSSELGFSRQDRNTNVRRVGVMASKINLQGGIAICALIAPFDKIRKELRKKISSSGDFLLVYVATPIELCEARDKKGLYSKARAGKLMDFTGISSPYEAPEDYDIYLDASHANPDQLADQIVAYLKSGNYINSK